MSRHVRLRRRAVLLAGAALASPSLAQAQSTPAPSSDPAVAPAPQPVSTAGTKRTYLPADFARFAPQTAYDMLTQVPGFTIRSADQERGLGQASENVLINGERIANKSGGAIDELRKVPAGNVERIEIVDASSLGIAGLVGQVANVVVKASGGGKGQFEWSPNFRAHFARPNLYSGSISYSGKAGGWLDYTLSVEDQTGRGGLGGPVLITDGSGALIERRYQIFHSESDLVTGKIKLGFRGPGSAKGNLTLAGTPYFNPVYNADTRVRADGDDRSRVNRSQLNGFYYDISGDYDFRLGPGRLKLIGLRHLDHEPILQTQITRFVSGAPDTGTMFGRNSYIGETVGRAEYSWKMGKNALQLSFERAFNSLDQRGTLFNLSPAGTFDPIPFPGGSGKVEETRYEGTATLSRPLGPKLDLQLVLGAEQSTLTRVDGNLAPRKFFRPKGSVSLGYRPSPGWDTSLKLTRRVGQISFYDFLSQPNLSQDRQNAGNPDLVPPQSWELEGEIGRELGRWGKTRLRTYAHKITDIIDIIPIGASDEGVGNLPNATRFGIVSTSTIQFDPIGWRGAKLDATLGTERTRVRDPLTGVERSIGGNHDAWMDFSFRQDVPRSHFAYGAEAQYDHFNKTYYTTEVLRSWEGPWFVSAFVERKNLAGLTVRFTVINLNNARHRLDRYVYDGRRTTNPLLFREVHDQLIGPIFAFSVKGNF
ncbi:TonB-dependent receptor plug domain-containing protein [Sphingomonas bacterium]|uniref:TonB-dependent receptor plug domain-containing protein n=1 Tax=Sphingomonas bacterium TaxID=1895847 RepID=UPI00262ED42A|nr:TonB-dependent receptor plug domain-containing protein [Sphingomonas bacterium]MDB5677344.1 TonB-dependent receptor [Sphingomonas bacterium]